MRWVGMLALAGLLAGCGGGFQLVPPGRTVAGAFNLQPGVAWSRFNPPTAQKLSYEFWTIDGITIGGLLLFSGIPDGETMYRSGDTASTDEPGATQPEPKRGPAPVYRKGMTATEAMEFVEASLARNERIGGLTTRNLRPQSFLGGEGFRFEYGYTSRDGLDRDGLAVGVERDSKLYLMLYNGTRLYHYGLHLPEVERMIQSAQLAKG